MSRNLIAGNIEIMSKDVPGLLTLNQTLELISKIGDGWRLPMRTEEVHYFMNIHSLGILNFEPREAYWAGMGMDKSPGTGVYVEGWAWWIDDRSVGWDRSNGNNTLRVRLLRDI
jgi:hypothetical protein